MIPIYFRHYSDLILTLETFHKRSLKAGESSQYLQLQSIINDNEHKTVFTTVKQHRFLGVSQGSAVDRDRATATDGHSQSRCPYIGIFLRFWAENGLTEGREGF